MTTDEIMTVDMALMSARTVVASPIWTIEVGWLREAAVTSAAIHLNDALRMLSRADHRVNFSYDGDEGDVTDLVSRYRNAACHFGSQSRLVGTANVSFLTQVGRGGRVEVGDVVLENPHEDDIAYHYGTVRIFHRRHLERACFEATAALRTIADAEGFPTDMLTPER